MVLLVVDGNYWVLLLHLFKLPLVAGSLAPVREASIRASEHGTIRYIIGKFGPDSECSETAGGHPISLGGASVPFRNPPMQGGLVTVSQNVGVYVTLVACYFIDDWNRCVRMLSLQ